ncbi:MAG TPA: prepilin-type N-terminal cleavage/methylation domain-containing protein [Candidatus Hydrogenedens sp.]|nr:prepilin-type N-terminal cleavage/methylation domain-containing protein [Candidatus Hydrogenedens sp.]HOL18655.1 prepilin-type N-terminal cleavage/methylation domain-containing protein [Candidatus Hydrogenedens sp.]HPP57499.1 prepilin-type N-terminal cleavage/methylation domain-containing protein [Candidatus Hydrogenedens sp.]
MRFGFYTKKNFCDKSIPFFSKCLYGFSLIELIVALAVVSVAVTGLVQMFSISLNLSQRSQNIILANSIAQDKLYYLINNPQCFLWKISEAGKEGGYFPILTSNEEPKSGNPVEEPKITPPDWASFRKYKNANQKFRWKAYGKISNSNENCYEVIVIVIYKEGGRTRYYTETSIVPRFQVDTIIRSNKT